MTRTEIVRSIRLQPDRSTRSYVVSGFSRTDPARPPVGRAGRHASRLRTREAALPLVPVTLAPRVGPDATACHRGMHQHRCLDGARIARQRTRGGESLRAPSGDAGPGTPRVAPPSATSA